MLDNLYNKTFVNQFSQFQAYKYILEIVESVKFWTRSVLKFNQGRESGAKRNYEVEWNTWEDYK